MPIYGQTTNYKAALAFPPISGLTIGGVAISAQYEIPITIEQYTAPNAKSNVNVITAMPVATNNFSFGGSALGHGALQLPTLTVGGFMEAPTVASSSNMRVPDVVVDGVRLTYADLVIMYWEGRAGNWSRIDPVFFRDSYGRQFLAPTIMDFTASYVEGVPGRTSFTLQLQV